MTKKYRAKKELRRMYKNNEVISLCFYPKCCYHRVDDIWIKEITRPNYERYSHTLCPEHLEEALEFNGNKRLQQKLKSMEVLK